MACMDMNRVINDKPVYVRQWAATLAIKNLSMALSTFGGPFGTFVDGDSKFLDTLRLLQGTEPDKLMPLLMEFVCCARIDGQEVTPATFNSIYNGELELVFKVFGFVCEVQYKDFFDQGQEVLDQS